MPPKIAIACSGLGHVRRGNETWARDVAEALHRAGTEVTLLGGGPLAGVDCRYQPLFNLRREAPLLRKCLSWHRRYLIEQATFSRSLLKHLATDRYDIIHVADPALAWRLQRNAARGSAQVIYKDGLLLGPEWCSKFDHVQVLAPYYRDQAMAAGKQAEGWFVIPHLVDTNKFAPSEDRAAARAEVLGAPLPPDAFVVMAAGDFSAGSNKRLDWIIGEFAGMAAPNVHLLLAGQSSPDDIGRLTAKAGVLANKHIHFFANVSRERMVSLYQAADVFVHAALREPFGIVLLEAMASGLPVLGHQFAVTRWIVGEGGEVMDMSVPGALAAALTTWQERPAMRSAAAQRARQRTGQHFSPPRIVPLYQAMYESVWRG